MHPESVLATLGVLLRLCSHPALISKFLVRGADGTTQLAPELSALDDDHELNEDDDDEGADSDDADDPDNERRTGPSSRRHRTKCVASAGRARPAPRLVPWIGWPCDTLALIGPAVPSCKIAGPRKARRPRSRRPSAGRFGHSTS